MQMTFHFCRFLVCKKIQWLIVILSVGFCCSTNAATYNLSTGNYPPCNNSWSVSGTTYTCTGNGNVTLAAGDVLTSNTNITISANNGFSLNNNTIGSSANRINLVSTYGAYNSSATTNIWGNVTSDGVITLAGTTVNGTITTNGNISLTGGGVTGLVTSNNNTITTNGTNLSGGATAQSGMSITGGTLAGNFVMTSNNVMTLSGVTMTSGSISGASTVTIQSGSVLGSASSSVSVSSTSGAITVNNSIVYGSLTAPDYSTVNVTNGGAVYGTCSPGSTPANACGSIPPSPMNCPAGIASGITGSYYNNRTLTEPSSATRSDAPIDFNWGGAAPGASGINADNFSVRWSGYVHVTQSGNYRFRTISDDGVRLYINGNLVIDRWNVHSATTDTTGNISLVAGQAYTIVLEYYENGGEAVIGLQWRLPGSGSYVAIPGGPTPTLGAGLYECVPDTELPITSCPTTLSAGITGDYFNNQSLTAPVTSRRSDGPINFDWSTGAPGPAGIGVNNFSVRWDGYIRVTQSGIHRFQTNSDDGVRLTVNGNLLIDQWNDHAVTTHTSGAVNLVAGNSYPIKLEYYENGGFSVAQLLWQTPGGGSYAAIPSGVNASPISAPGLYECVTVPASYDVTNNATGLTCAAEQVTVTARNAAGVVYNPPAGTLVTLSTTPNTGVWVGGNTFTFTGGESSFIKYLQQTTPATLVINANLPTSPTSPSITFADTGLKIAFNSALAVIPTQVAGVAGTAMVKAIRTSTTTGACEAVIGAGVRPVALAYVCLNPETCMAGETFTVNGFNITANNDVPVVSYNNVNLTFNANGEAPLTINYSDVGQIRLQGQLVLTASGNNPAITLSGSSDPFIVKPYALALSDVRNSTGTRILPLTAPGNNTVNTTGFVAAEEAFHVRVQARDALGGITPNYGRETLTTPENVVIDIQGITNPVGGDTGVLASKNTFALTTTPGEFQNTVVNWNNVGTIQLFASIADGNYLGVGDVSQKPPVNVGRFYPDHFTLASSTLANSCSSFSYMSQPLTLQYTLQAQGVTDNVLSNYEPAYGTMPTISYVAENANTGINLERFSDGVARAWLNGEVIVNSSAAMFSRSSPNAVPDGPYESLQMGLQVVDAFDSRQLRNLNMNAITTGVCGSACTAITLGSALNMRYGRLRLDDAFGPETANLPINFATEYWVGSFFVTNANDSCTKVLRSDIGYPSGNILTPANLTVPLTGGTTTGSYSSTTATEINFTSGSAQHFFTAPTGGAQGSFNVDVDLTSYPWLHFDWNQDGNYSDANLPTARFGFGSYRGHDRIIYWRERFQ